MTPNHHASEDTLWSYAVGALPPGAQLVVSAHLEVCFRCSAEMRFLESVGGALLSAVEPEPLSPHSLDKALVAIEAQVAEVHLPRKSSPPLPRALRGRRVGSWRWAGPGLSVAPVIGAAGAGERVYLLRAQAGAKLPRHSHNGAERVQVLQGAFADGAHYDAGDLCETARDDHEPAATAEGMCICLVATEGPLRFSGLAKLMQPFLGV